MSTGLGSGELQVLEMPSGRCESRMELHTERITELLCIGSHIWTSSFDATICVIDAPSRRTVTVIEALDDAVTCLVKSGQPDDLRVRTPSLLITSLPLTWVVRPMFCLGFNI